MSTDTTSQLWASPAGNYFWVAIGYWLFGLCNWTLPLPRQRRFIEATAVFCVIQLLCGFSVFFGRALPQSRSETTGRHYTDTDWIYVDEAAQAWLHLQLVWCSWSGFSNVVSIWWFQWIPFVMLTSAFTPLLSIWQPAAYLGLIAGLPAVACAGLYYRETRGRWRAICYVALPLLVARAVCLVVFPQTDFAALGLSYVRGFDTLIAPCWFQYWIQSEQEYMTPCWTRNAPVGAETAAVV